MNGGVREREKEQERGERVRERKKHLASWPYIYWETRGGGTSAWEREGEMGEKEGENVRIYDGADDEGSGGGGREKKEGEREEGRREGQKRSLAEEAVRDGSCAIENRGGLKN